jgi:hypothetical protein
MSAQQAEREFAALQHTIQRLESEISAARDRAMKLAHYIEMAREFGEGGVANPMGGSPNPTGESTNRPNGAGSRMPKGGMSGRAVQECIAILRERKERIPLRKLYELIQQRGIHLGGKSPINSLSGYLSRTPGLTGDKTLGWGLQEWAGD